MKSGLNYTKIIMKAQKHLSDGILIFDTNQKRAPLVFVNKSVNKILGYSNKELIGKTYKFLESKDSTQENLDKMRDRFVNKKKNSCTSDLTIKTKNGGKIYCRISITPVPNGKGGIEAIVCILRNITEDREKLINKLKLSVVETTLNTVNDVVYNYMNGVQLFRNACEEHVSIREIRFDVWDKHHHSTLDTLRKINEMKEYKEKKITDSTHILNHFS